MLTVAGGILLVPVILIGIVIGLNILGWFIRECWWAILICGGWFVAKLFGLV